MRRVRDALWTAFLAVAAAEVVAVVVPVPFGAALTGALLCLAACLTVAQGVRSGDIAFLVAVARRRLRENMPGMSGSLGAVVLDSAPLGERALMFTTNSDRPRRFIKTDRGPVGIRFMAPVEREISTSQVPCKLKRAGLTILRLEQFTEDGIVISKQLPGIEVRAEVSYQSAPLRSAPA